MKTKLLSGIFGLTKLSNFHSNFLTNSTDQYSNNETEKETNEFINNWDEMVKI